MPCSYVLCCPIILCRPLILGCAGNLVESTLTNLLSIRAVSLNCLMIVVECGEWGVVILASTKTCIPCVDCTKQTVHTQTGEAVASHESGGGTEYIHALRCIKEYHVTLRFVFLSRSITMLSPPLFPLDLSEFIVLFSQFSSVLQENDFLIPH